jgi:transcriptional regulator NrdR family protein
MVRAIFVTIIRRSPFMECPKCDGKTQVIDSRAAGGRSWRRRRSCPACGFRFSTKEISGEFIDNILLENKTLKQTNQVFERALGIDQPALAHAVKDEVNIGGF